MSAAQSEARHLPAPGDGDGDGPPSPGSRHLGLALVVIATDAAIADHALAVGFSRGFEVSAGIMLLALIVTVGMIRVRREDMAGVQPV